MENDVKKRIFKNDLLLIGAILFIAMALSVIVYLVVPKSGNHITVTLDGEVYGTYSLQVDREIEIKTEFGENVISIHNGEVQIMEADCPDQICVKHRPVHRTMESIICLPHKLVITVDNLTSFENEIDGVTN